MGGTNKSKIHPGITVSPFYGYGIPPGKSLDGDSDSPYPRTDIKDICWLSIKDSRSTLYNRKGQPVKKCNRTSKMSYQKGRRTMAPKKKEKNLKRSNIITLKLTDIELAVISNKIIPILLHAFFLHISVLQSYVVISDRKGNIMLQKLYVFFKKVIFQTKFQPGWNLNRKTICWNLFCVIVLLLCPGKKEVLTWLNKNT